MTLFFFTPCAAFSATGVKTSFKKYSLFTYDGRTYLCEPYQVKKNEWLYKIFRQKGEISASDFPLFLKIFRHINPKIGNIDAISPGSRIMIPLKQVEHDAYEQVDNTTVEVPMLAFSAQIAPDTVSRHTRKHKVKAGDTISQLLSKEFLTSGGNVSKKGVQAVLHLNPNIKDINYIYQGASIVLPDPSILSQPWFNAFIAMGKQGVPTQELSAEKKRKAPLSHRPKPISRAELEHLKRYSRLIHGHLMHQGKLFFPPNTPEASTKFIDLSKTPVISDDTGKKTVLLGSDDTEATLDPDLVSAMKAYWKHLEFKKFSEIFSVNAVRHTQTMKDIPKSREALLPLLLADTPYTYTPQVSLPVSFNKVQMTVSLGRITHDRIPDILINLGNVYGSTLERLKNQGYRILDLSPELSFEETCLRLFSQLGYQVWKNPAFNVDRKVKTIPGVYAEKGVEKLFLARTPLYKSATIFLKNEQINVIMLDKEPAQ
ncbi:MAG: hypothetical protein MI799_12785 [Desulfobacterales bacterium]|nr:hypothetical protein [Desulfobacterales bacterium]